MKAEIAAHKADAERQARRAANPGLYANSVEDHLINATDFDPIDVDEVNFKFGPAARSTDRWRRAGRIRFQLQ